MKSVYIASAGPSRHKIGIAEQPEKRVRALSNATGWPLKLVGVHAVRDAAAVERMAHWLLADKRGLGEWFSVGAEEARAAILNAAQRIEAGEPAPRLTAFPVRIVLPITQKMLLDIDAALAPGGDRVSFIRTAIDRELTRRERDSKRKG